MIFPTLEIEEKLQVNDKTRIDATKSFTTPDEASITLIEIEPSSGDGFIDVTSTKYLDYSYSTDGNKTISVRVTTDGSPTVLSKTLNVLSLADDRLFSSDSELLPYEPDILNYVRAGRNSYLDVHRAAQDRIIKWLDEHRIWDVEGNRLDKNDIIDLEEVNDWSKFMTLKFIFEGLSNATDDIFHEKALRYKQMEIEARNRAAFRLDRDNDGTEEEYKQDNRSSFMVRR